MEVDLELQLAMEADLELQLAMEVDLELQLAMWVDLIRLRGNPTPGTLMDTDHSLQGSDPSVLRMLKRN